MAEASGPHGWVIIPIGLKILDGVFKNSQFADISA
jgi:hypothetical protein